MALHPDHPDFSRAVTSEAAATIIETMLSDRIAACLDAKGSDAISISVGVILDPERSSLDIMLRHANTYVFLPPVLEDADIPVADKRAYYEAFLKYGRDNIHIGSFQDMIEEAARQYWDGAETDDEARTFLLECCGEDEASLGLMPSELKERIPEWARPATDNARPILQPGTERVIEDLKAAAVRFRKDKRRSALWTFDREVIEEIDPSMTDTYWMPPVWLVKSSDENIALLNEICQPAMEYGQDDVCGAVRVTSTRALLRTLNDLAKGGRYLAAVNRFLAFAGARP